MVEVVWNVGSLLWILGAGLDSFSTIDPGARNASFGGSGEDRPERVGDDAGL